MSTIALQSELEDEFEFEDESTAPGGWGAAATSRAVRAALRGTGVVPATEYEFEDEGEWEEEAILNPIRRVYPDALMEHLAHAAAESESEAEAEAFIGALVPLAAQLLPGVAPAVLSAAPRLVRGLAGVTRALRRNPATRPLVRALPAVMRRTAADLQRTMSSGRPITGQMAARSLARQTARVLNNPRRAAQAVRRSRALDRRYHAARGAVRPTEQTAGACPCVCDAAAPSMRRRNARASIPALR